MRPMAAKIIERNGAFFPGNQVKNDRITTSNVWKQRMGWCGVPLDSSCTSPGCGEVPTPLFINQPRLRNTFEKKVTTTYGQNQVKNSQLPRALITEKSFLLKSPRSSEAEKTSSQSGSCDFLPLRFSTADLRELCTQKS